MPLTLLVYRICDILGTAAFAVCGAMVASRKGVDLFGIIFLAEITALGGGMTRDLLLGQPPPALFTNTRALVIALVMALAVFFLIRYHREFYFKEVEAVERINNLVDAVGLGLFAVSGCQVAIAARYGDQPFLTICMGTLTAVGGGLLRDIILREIPFIFTKHVYAVAAICGASVYYALHILETGESVATVISVLVTFILRYLATTYRWNLPKP